jgi:hypothetical protein
LFETTGEKVSREYDWKNSKVDPENGIFGVQTYSDGNSVSSSLLWNPKEDENNRKKK